VGRQDSGVYTLRGVVGPEDKLSDSPGCPLKRSTLSANNIDFGSRPTKSREIVEETSGRAVSTWPGPTGKGAEVAEVVDKCVDDYINLGSSGSTVRTRGRLVLLKLAERLDMITRRSVTVLLGSGVGTLNSFNEVRVIKSVVLQASGRE